MELVIKTKTSVKIHLQKLQAFSLLETLVALVIFSLVFVGVAQYLVIDIKAKQAGLQLERVLRFSNSLLAQAQAIEDASILANYSGNCVGVTSSLLSQWCYEFVETSEYSDKKEVVFYDLTVKTSYTRVANTEKLHEFKVLISWKTYETSVNKQELTRSIFIYK